MNFPRYSKNKVYFWSGQCSKCGASSSNPAYHWCPDGWGIVGWNRNHSVVHDYCNDRIRLAKEDNVLFWFCEQCMVKTDRNGKTLSSFKKFLN